MKIKLFPMVFSLLILTACAASGINHWQPNIIDLQQEAQLGQDFSKEKDSNPCLFA